MGQDQIVTLTFSRPNSGVERVTNNIVAGSYNALILDLQSITGQMVEQRKPAPAVRPGAHGDTGGKSAPICPRSSSW